MTLRVPASPLRNQSTHRFSLPFILFSVISFSTSPQLHHTPFSISTLSNLFIFLHNTSYIVPFANRISTSLKLSLVTIINASNLSHFSFHHFYTEFQVLNLSIHICPQENTNSYCRIIIHCHGHSKSKLLARNASPLSPFSDDIAQFLHAGVDVFQPAGRPGQSLASEEDLSIMFTPSSLRI